MIVYRRLWGEYKELRSMTWQRKTLRCDTVIEVSADPVGELWDKDNLSKFSKLSQTEVRELTVHPCMPTHWVQAVYMEGA